MTPTYQFMVAVTLLLSFGVCDLSYATQNDQPKRVLVLYSHQTSAPINSQWDSGIRRALAKGFPSNLEIEVEHLDLERTEGSDYGEMLREYLRLKYAETPVTAVIPVFSQAFTFVMKNRGLFQNAPVVFCSVPLPAAEKYRGVANATGVVFAFDYAETAKLTQALFPDTRKLLVLSGLSSADKAVNQMARRALGSFDIEIEFAEGMPLDDIPGKIAESGPQTVVLMLVHGTDIHGRYHTPVETVQTISKQHDAPVFGLYDTLLGHGIVGGKLCSAEHQGILAGQLAVRILNGEDADEIPFAGLNTNEFVFDARQLKRWGISEAQLPTGSIVQFKEVSLWQQYGNYILAIVTAILVQSLVIAYLVMNRLRRLRAERSLQKSQTQARDLAGKLISAQEDEQRRLARELHDDLSQRMAASAIMAAKLEQKEPSSDDFQPSLSRLKEDLIQISEDVHLISRQIHPSIVDDLGISVAVRNLCDRLANRIEAEVSYRSGDIPSDLPKNITSCIYRISQEAMQNAAKHSMAYRIEVMLSADDEGIYLEVRDCGVGFDPSKLDGAGGLGLESMKERARLVCGIVDIDSAPGSGTTVSVNIPLPGEEL